ncbi:MAG: SUMF1/EgtB/PvdO family nonheme iron enzyme [Candidatus Methylumidiphilus sp.]
MVRSIQKITQAEKKEMADNIQHFRVALSFPGEHREYVHQIAGHLADALGREQVFYDEYWKAKLPYINFDSHLQDIYHKQSDLIAVFLCKEYKEKQWCGLEWRVLRDLIKQGRGEALMPIRLDDSDMPGIYSIDRYEDADNQPPEVIADAILHRLQALADNIVLPVTTGSTRLRTAYLNQMSLEWRDLPLRVLESRNSDPTGKTPPVDLEQVYIALNTIMSQSRLGRVAGGDQPEREKPLTAIEALSQANQGRLVLLGQPGSGKSTFGRYLCLMLAEHILEPGMRPLSVSLPGWEVGPVLPVFVPLRRLSAGWAAEAKEKRGSASDLEKFITADVGRRDGLTGYGGTLLEELKSQGGLVVFDGLDEVAAHHRERAKQALDDFAKRYRLCRVLATCRVHSYRLGDGWQLGWETNELADFSEEQIENFIKGWFAALACINISEREALARKAISLKGALGPDDPRGLREMAGKPLLLTVMAIVHNHKELPGSRVGVYRECVDILLQRWEAAKFDDGDGHTLLAALSSCGLSETKLHLALREIAYCAQRDGDRLAGPATVLGSVIAGVLSEYLRSSEGVDRFLEHCRYANGLLLLDTVDIQKNKIVEVYRFPHLTFQEYLAALHFMDMEDEIEEAVEKAGDPAWWEVARFYGEYLCYDEAASGNWRKITALLEGLCQEQPCTDDADWRRVWLAGILTPGWEARVKEKHQNPKLRQRIVTRLVELMQSGTALRNEPAARAAAGDTLGTLGDPRFDPGLCHLPCLYRGDAEPLFGFVEIAPGPFWMGSEKGDKDARDNEFGNKNPLTIPYPYRIARYPVTVAQFGAFIEDGGYADAAFWKNDAAWRWLKSETRTGPADWDGQRLHPNRPVSSVTWYESMAYCAWLETKLQAMGRMPQGHVIRLPSEAEWEKAARWRSGEAPSPLRYPWGKEDWSPDRANIDESGISHPTPVGMYPEGATASGLYDMAGNVFEWTVTGWGDYPYDTKRNGEQGNGLVVRGGSCYYDSLRARCASRSRNNPGYIWLNVGFRVVLSLANADF